MLKLVALAGICHFALFFAPAAAENAHDPIFASTATQQAYLKASNTETGDYFGISVAASGNTVVVGVYDEDSNATGVGGNQDDNSATGSGAAFVFVREGNTWSQQAYLKASNTETGDHFATKVGISGDTIVVGARGEDSGSPGVDGDQADNSASNAGAVYVFVREGTAWSQQAYLKASNPDASDAFGYPVAISGDTIVVGAEGEDSNTTGVNGDQTDNSASEAGAAYVFVRDGTTWSQQAYLKASNTEERDFFGASVSVSGNALVVGAEDEDSDATGVNGNQDDNSAEGSGAAYVFVRDGSTWSQQAYLKASNPEEDDYFGAAVAVSGQVVVVGAYGEDSSSTTVNRDQHDNDEEDSGAAYVFVRNGSTWSQQAYLKSSDTYEDDSLGESVAVSGDLIVVGASSENDTEGAAHVFVRDGDTWKHQDHLTADNAESSDWFGAGVAVTGNTVLASAYGEDSAATGVNGDQSDNSAGGSGAVYAFGVYVDPWLDLANSLPGTAGQAPALEATGMLVEGQTVTLDLSGGLPFGAANLVVGDTRANMPLKGGVLVPAPDHVFAGMLLDSSGSLRISFTWPAGTPPGMATYFQCWNQDPGGPFGFSASNALHAATP